VDGKKEGKEYDGIFKNSLIFSSDGNQVAYAAVMISPIVGPKCFVVVNGKEGKQYDNIIRQGGIIFDSPDSLHYLALKGSDIYLVEERIR